MAKILAVNLSEKKGDSKHPIEKGYFKVDHGLEGDAHAGKGHRQVSLLGRESIEKIRKMGIEGLCTGKFAENLTTDGIRLYELPIGTVLRIDNVLLEVTQIGKKCYIGCEIRNQEEDCPMPREVIFAKVLVGGWIKPEDEIVVEGGMNL